MIVTKLDCTKAYILKLQQYAKTIAPSMRFVFNDMDYCNDFNHICVSYEINVHEQNAIQQAENLEELKASPKTAYNKRQHGSKAQQIKLWLVGLFQPKLPEQINNGVR